jgi:hypothetical protein
MAFVSDNELFGSGQPAAAPQKPTSGFVSDAELSADFSAQNTPQDDYAPNRPDVSGRTSKSDLRKYEDWKATHDDFGRPLPQAAPGRRYASDSNEGKLVEDLALNAVDAAAVVGDMTYGAPAQLYGVGKNVGSRLQTMVANTFGANIDRRTADIMASSAQQAVPEILTSPFLTIQKWLNGGSESDGGMSAVMAHVDEAIHKGTKYAAARSGDLLTEGELQTLVDTSMAAFGAKAITHSLERSFQKWQQTPVDVPDGFVSGKKSDARLRRDGGGYDTAVPDAVPDAAPYESRANDPNFYSEYQHKKATEKDLSRSDAMTNAEQQAYDFMQRGASKAEVERAVRKNPLVGEAMDAITARRGMVKESRLGEVLQGEVVDGVADVRDSRVPEGGDLPPLSRPGTSLATIVRESSESGGPTAPPKLGGVDPKRLAQLGLGGAGIALALTYPDDSEEKATALATLGVLYVGKNKGLTFDKLANYTQDAPLGHLLNNSEYTTKVLDRLPRNKKIFTRQEVMQEVMRQDVTEVEKNLFVNALDAVGKDKFSATDLMLGVKEFAEQHEFKRRETQDFADYGLEGIDRSGEEAARGMNQWEPEDGVGDGKPPLVGVPVTTTTYTNPKVSLEKLKAHFNADVIGHTRSFVEKGIRHVVEVQSDFFQKAADLGIFKSLAKHWPKRLVREELARAAEVKETPEFIEAKDRAKQLTAEGRSYESMARDDSNASVRAMAKEEALQRFERAIEQLTPFTAGGEPRYLPKETSVRFATADTVAKVEGWPVTNWADEVRLAKINLAHYDASVADSPGVVSAQNRLRLAKENLKKFGDKEVLKDPGHQSLYDRHKSDVEAFTKKLGGKEITDDKGHTWIEVPLDQPKTSFRGPPQMYGKADPEFVRILGGAGAGAVIAAYLADDEHKFVGAGIGMLVGALAGGAAWPAVGKGFEYGLGAPSTTILNASPPLIRRGYNMTRRTLVGVHNAIERTNGLKEAMYGKENAVGVKTGGLGKKSLRDIKIAIVDNNPKKIAAAFAAAGRPALATEYIKVRKLLDEYKAELKSYGILSDTLDNYFPRSMKDFEGFKKSIGQEAASKLEQKLKDAEKRSFMRNGMKLNDTERDIVINSFLRSREAMTDGRSFSKERRLDEVTEKTVDFYEDPIVTLHSYLASATKAIELAKFFGKDLKSLKEGALTTIDSESSIGSLIRSEIDAGHLKVKDVDSVEGALRSVLVNGEKPANAAVQDARSIINASLLANPVSAVNQLNEMGPIMYMHGVIPAVHGLARQVTGRGTVDLRDIGLAEHIAQEFSGERNAAIATKKLFKASGFTAADSLMKNTSMEARKIKLQGMVKTAAGLRELKAKYGEFFGQDYAQMVADIKAGKDTELVAEVGWYELSEGQPLSNWEIPRALLDNPNGRILASLKTFMLKQMDIVRRGAVKDFRKGDYLKGSGKLLRMAMLYGIAGVPVAAVTNLMLNRAVDDVTLKGVLSNFAKTFMWSNYLSNQFDKKGPLKILWENVIAPPVKVFDDFIAPAYKHPVTEGEQEKLDAAFAKTIPGFGKLYEAWLMGGGKKFDKQQDKFEKADATNQVKKDAAREKGSALSEEDLKALRQYRKMKGGQ